MLESFTCATFEPRLGEAFLVHVDDRDPVEMVLVEASEQQHVSRPGARVPFSIVFRAPSEPVYPQRIYRMDHAAIGTFELFLVPIGPDADGMRYQAVFS